jgi:hypothetical protein
MVVPRTNRTREVLLILVPVALVNLVWLAATRLFNLATSDKETFAMVVLSLTAASAVLWLLGHGIARYTPYKGIVLALGIAAGLALMGMFSVVDVSRRTLAFASLSGVLMPALVLGYVLAGRMSRRAYRPIRFLLFLALWTMAFSTVAMFLWFLLGSAASGDWPTDAVSLLVVTVVAGAIIGACVFLISLAFVLVGLRSPLFRPRLFACLRMQPAPGPPTPVQ